MKILITSNTKKYFNTYIDFIDHYWIRYFEKRKIKFTLIPNSKNLLPNYLSKNVDLILLPGGNDIFEKNKSSKNRLIIENKLIKFSIRNKIPLLGICRGMQVINLFFGGKIEKISGHMKKSTKITMKQNLFKTKTIKVKCFHNYGIKPKSLSKNLEIHATDKYKNIEMLKHKDYFIRGLMWHPERESNFNKLDIIFKNLRK